MASYDILANMPRSIMCEGRKVYYFCGHPQNVIEQRCSNAGTYKCPWVKITLAPLDSTLECDACIASKKATKKPPERPSAPVNHDRR